MPFFRLGITRTKLCSALFLTMLVVIAVGVTAQEPKQLPRGADSGAALAASIEGALQQAIAKCEKSVVSIAIVPRNFAARIDPADRAGMFRLDAFPFPIETDSPTSPDFVPTEFATGVIIDASGLILTNYHALRLAESTPYDYYVTTAGRKVFNAQLKARGADPRSDLAVLQVLNSPVDRKAFPPMPMGDAATLRKGQIVVTLGNPYAIARDGEASASWGIVANLGRKAPALRDETWLSGVRKDTIHHLGTLIQTDAKLNLGTSGGALINLRGEMVGLTTSMAALAGYEQAAGYAIAADGMFRRVVESLKRGEEVEYGFLGILPENIEGEGDRPRGARVGRIEPGTPAQRAELNEGDVIETVDGAAVTDRDALMLAVSSRAPGDTVSMAIRRENQRFRRSVTLAKLRVDGRKIISSPPPAWRGMSFDFRSVLVGRGEVPGDAARAVSGVAILEVTEESAAAKAGLQPSSVVTHVDGAAIDTPGEFRKAVSGKSGPVELQLSSGEKFTVAPE